MVYSAMANPYGIKLDDHSLRWAAAEGVPESVIAAICLLEHRSVDEIVAKLSPAELGAGHQYRRAVSELLSARNLCGPHGQEEFGIATAADGADAHRSSQAAG